MLMILARLVRSESFWAVVKVRSPHTGPEPGYPRMCACSCAGGGRGHAGLDQRLSLSCSQSTKHGFGGRSWLQFYGNGTS